MGRITFGKLCGAAKFNLNGFWRKNVSYNGIKQFLGSRAKLKAFGGGSIKIGKSLYLSESCSVRCSSGGKLVFGDNNFFNRNCTVNCLSSISIGDNNLFGPNVVIVDHNHNYEDPDALICKQGYKYKNVSIGSDCWICANVVVCPGAEIGDHIVVAANSVVNGKLDKPGVYAGMPAKLVKER